MSEDFVTVVSGVPRSGTSLLMQMLGAGGHPLLVDSERAADVHNPRGYFEYGPVKRLPGDVTWVPRARGHAVKVIHALVRHLPSGHEYRVLWMRRDLREVVASQDAMLSGAAVGGPEPERLAEIYAAQLREAEAELSARSDVRILRVEHAALLADPTPVAEEIARFLGGGLDVADMAAVVDPHLHRQRGGGGAG